MKTVFLVLALIISHVAFSQPDLKFLKAAVSTLSFDNLETKAKEGGYSFDKGQIQKDSVNCFQYYTFVKYVSATVPYNEKLSIRTKCSDDDLKFFTVIRLLTRNEQLFYSIKEECKKLPEVKSISEKVVGKNVVSTYANPKDIFRYIFTNGTDVNGKVYFVDIVNDSEKEIFFTR